MISVVVCTRDRAARLARLLASLARATPPARAAWELLVVDNGSSDATQAVLAEFTLRLPLRVVVERAAGHSHARNAGVAAARGDWLVWTDDDVVVGDGWLRAYETAFARHPDAAFFGGPIRPRFEGTPPPWLTATVGDVAAAFAGLDLGADEIPIGDRPRTLPFGANVAIRGREQRVFRFDPHRGHAPGRRFVGGDESDVLRRIVAHGGAGWWVPDAAVEHWVAAERQTVRHLRAYFASAGWGVARRAAIDRPPTAAALLATALRLAREEAVCLVARLARRPARWVPALRRASYLRGALVAQHARRREAATTVGAAERIA